MSTFNGSLVGKSVWLVGASEGIGRSVALKLKAEGAKIIISARNIERLETLAEELGSSCHVVPIDVSDNTSVSEAFEKLSTLYGTPDKVIYNAGYYHPMGAKDFDLTETEAMLDVNFRGACRVLAAIIPAFLKRKSGHIILVGSLAGYRGLPNAIGYGASKAALIHLAENLVCDLTKFGIRTQLISPGFVKTRLTDKNNFSMPSMISPDAAAAIIVKGIQKNVFEVRFPWLFSTGFKIIGLFPFALYARLLRTK